MYLLFCMHVVPSLPLGSSINCLYFSFTSQEATSKFANLDSSEKENQKKSQKRLQLQKNKVCLGVFLPFLNW